MAGVTPVFFKADQRKFSNHEVCLAVESCVGVGSCHGAQKIGQLWRIYVTSTVHRINLLAKGLVLQGEKIELASRNPFIIRNDTGEEIPLTKLYVRDVPISYANEEIMKGLGKVGINMRSKMEMERVRGPDGKLTNWVTGARIVWIEVPKEKIPGKVDCGVFKASLFYREMLQDIECRNCLMKGHKAKFCRELERCRRCKKVGHKMAVCGENLEEEERIEINETMREIESDRASHSDGNEVGNREEEDTDGEDRENYDQVNVVEIGQRKESEPEISNVKQKKQSPGRSNGKKRGANESSQKGKGRRDVTLSSSEDEQEENKLEDKNRDKKKTTSMEASKEKDTDECSTNADTEDELKKTEGGKSNRSRPMVKGKKPNTLDRFITRSGSRK